TCARDERDRAPRDKLADENHTAPPGIRRFSPYIETQIHFFKVAVQWDGDTEKTGVEKQKSDHAEKGLTIIEVDLCATRNQRREQARIDDIIQHGEVTPVSSEKWLHVMILPSESAAVELIGSANAISRSKSLRLRNRTEVGALRGENPFGPSFVLLRWRTWNFQLNELRPAWFITDRGKKRSGVAVCQQRDVSRNGDVLGIFCNRAPIDESKTTLLIISVKTDPDAVTIGLVWNLKRRWRTKLELQFQSFAIDPRRF